jgi:hypothetical protein
MPDVEHLAAEYPGSENEGDKYARCPGDEDFLRPDRIQRPWKKCNEHVYGWHRGSGTLWLQAKFKDMHSFSNTCLCLLPRQVKQ